MAMFVTPWMLAGGLLVAVPIVLHLVMREKPKHLVFPALRFIQQRREANRRKLRLRHLVLLALRCAIVLLFALALARPVFQSSGFFSGRTPVAAALVFDNRPRMAYKHQNETRLQAAQKLGGQLLEQLPRDSDLVVLDAASPRQRFDVDRGAAAQRIEQLAITYSERDLIEMLDTALGVVRESDKERKEVFVFTDLAAADWQSSKIVAKWRQRLEENPDTAVYVVDVGVKNPRDFALGDLRLSGDVLAENGLLSISTDVLAMGEGGRQTVQLFFIDESGNAEKRGEQTVDCRAGEAVQVEFKTDVGQRGTRQGFVRLARADNLAADNERFFTVRVQRPWRVLVVAPQPAAHYARFVTGVLSPTRLRQRGEAHFDCDVIATEELGNTRPDGYHAVWLLDPTPLKAEVWNQLAGYVTGGGGLAIALGGRAGLTADAFNATASMELVPAELKRQWKQYDLYLAPDRLEHPVLQKLKPYEGAIGWDALTVLKIWELGPLAEGVQTVINYSDRRPALLARNVGRGRVLTLTTSIVPSSRSPWNALFLDQSEIWVSFQLITGMTEYLVGSVGQQLNYRVGEVAELLLETTPESYTSYLLSAPDGTRRVKTGEQDDSVMIADTNRPGQYRLEAGGQQGVRYGFSVNLPAESTQVGRVDVAALRESLGDVNLPIADSVDSLRQSRKVSAARTRWEAYPWLILLLVLVVIGETLLSSLFYRKKREPAGRGETNRSRKQPHEVLASV